MKTLLELVVRGELTTYECAIDQLLNELEEHDLHKTMNSNFHQVLHFSYLQAVTPNVVTALRGHLIEVYILSRNYMYMHAT